MTSFLRLFQDTDSIFPIFALFARVVITATQPREALVLSFAQTTRNATIRVGTSKNLEKSLQCAFLLKLNEKQPLKNIRGTIEFCVIRLRFNISVRKDHEFEIAGSSTPCSCASA
jgi:hypothetical protein